MDEPPSGLPPGAFAPTAHHLNSYARFNPAPAPTQTPVRGPRQHEAFAHIDPNLSSLDPNHPFPPAFDAHLDNIEYANQYDPTPLPQQLYGPAAHTPTTPVQQQHPQQQQHHHGQPPRIQELPSHSAAAAAASAPAPPPHPPPPARPEEQVKSNGHLGVLIPPNQLNGQQYIQAGGPQQVQQDEEQDDGDEAGPDTPNAPKQGGRFPGMKQIPNPPNLEAWRQLLFEVDKPIELSQEEFQTYFPHVDNVYSHRSTQGYKRQPLVSHYWDCRLKGRPPGTPKSEDPNKRKRKRQARQRDLCDVKIKITEFHPQARQVMGSQQNGEDKTGNNGDFAPVDAMVMAGLVDASRPQPGADGRRYYKIERVNGNGGNGKSDGVAGPHKHTLAESDRIKKNSIQRALIKDQKVKKAAEKTKQKRATGAALATTKRHSKEDSVKFYASCSDPYSQRVWIALELKGVPYQYIEMDPAVGPTGLGAPNRPQAAPAIKHGSWTLSDSGVLVEYVEEKFPGQHRLLPANAENRAWSRMWAGHVTRHILPAFYRLLAAPSAQLYAEHAHDLDAALVQLVDAAHPTGPFFLGPHMSLVDVVFAPWVLRFARLLTPHRAWPPPADGSRWHRWATAIEDNDAVRRTTSADDLYRDSFARFVDRTAPALPGAPVPSEVEVAEGKDLP